MNGIKSTYSFFLKQPSLGKYVYFNNLASNNISTNFDSHNIVNWYLRWKNRDSEIQRICHSINDLPDFRLGKIEVTKIDEMPRLKGFKILKYVWFFLCKAIYSFLLFPFKPIYGFLFKELVELKRVELADIGDLARVYLFHNSSSFFRPIWTYEAEKKGARILLYFYSANIEVFKKETSSLQYPWHIVNWPHYLVWDRYQSDFLKEFTKHKSKIEVVGPIWFSSSEKYENILANSIAVFDITPWKPRFNIIFGYIFDYFVPKVANQFLNDIQIVLAKNDQIIVHKMKRTHSYTHKYYSYNIKRLNKKTNYQQANPALDALWLVKKTTATISMPFTSTALIARQEGKPSVYYDPTGMIKKDRREAHHIPVLSGIKELQEWVKKINIDK